MTLKIYLLIMGLASAVCWAAFGFIIFTTDPTITNNVGFLLFYSSLFLALTGTIAIIGFVIRFIALRQVLAFKSVKEAFRQSFLFAFAMIIILFWLARNLLNWWNVLFLIVGLSVFELFLLSYKKK